VRAAERAHLAAALARDLGPRPERLHRRGDVAHRLVGVQALEQRDRLFEVRRRVQIDPGLLPPEQVGHQHGVAFLGEIVRRPAHAVVDAEDLLQHHQPRAAALPVGGRRNRQVALERLAVARRDVDHRAGHLASFAPARSWQRRRPQTGFADWRGL